MMITKTTGEERITISNAMYGIMNSVQRAERTTRKLWDRYFSNEPAKIDGGEWEIEDIADTLYMVAETLYNACLEYGLTVAEDMPGVDCYIESAQTVLNVQEYERKKSDLLRHRSGVEAVQDTISKAQKLDDEEALKMIKEI